MDYYGNQVEKYHVFLNEARLTALAMSIYFVSIKRLMKNIEETNVIKLLVLDDILISLDMSNRIKLLSILKEEFSEYQILFFTHDKELFELYKSKLPEWKKYELYVDDSGYQPGALLKAGTSYLDRAKMYYAQKDYECCAVFLRKALEERIKLYLEPHEQRNKNCVELTLDDAVKKAILKSKKNDLNDLSVLFKKIHDHRKFILNPLTHDEAKNIHTSEMKSALEDIERLKGLIKGKIL
jgi:ABC-type multidrug transport system ATPase subunit